MQTSGVLGAGRWVAGGVVGRGWEMGDLFGV